MHVFLHQTYVLDGAAACRGRPVDPPDHLLPHRSAQFSVGCRATLSSQDLVAHGPAQGTYSWRLIANGLLAFLFSYVGYLSCRCNGKLASTTVAVPHGCQVPSCAQLLQSQYPISHGSTCFSLTCFCLVARPSTSNPNCSATAKV